MKITDLIAKSRRVLDLEQVRDTLATTSPEEVLQNTLAEASPPPVAPAASMGPMGPGGGFESAFESAPPEEAPQTELADSALQAEREATVEAGRRAVERVMAEGENADLSPREAMGLEAIILLFGRPAILIQDGKFFPPPEDWKVLENHRAAIERTFLSVGRIEVDGHPSLQWIGTGFLVGPDVLMTNRHVAMEFTAPKSNGRWGIAPGMKARVDFKEDLGATQAAEFAIEKLIGIHGRHDMALFRVARQGGSDGTLAAPEPLPLAAHPDSAGPVAGRNVYVVGYPAWDGRRNDPEPMQRLFGNIYNVKRLQPGTAVRFDADFVNIAHDCSTLGGNSGSCVVDLETHQVLGLHFGGHYQEENDAVALWRLQDDPLIKIGGLEFSLIGIQMIGIDAGASLWKLARVGETLETDLLPAGDEESVRARLRTWNADAVGITGGGARRLAAALDGLRVTHVSEFEAWGRGAPQLAERAGWALPERCLLVSLGTGTSMLEISAGTVRRVGGTALGGGTLLGLGRLLCQAESFAEIVALASRGERGRVDLLVRDVYPEGGDNLALDPDWTASNFAKLASREPADLAHALMGLLGENIGIACTAVAHALSIETLVFGGSPLETNPTLQDILRQTVALGGKEARLLPDGGFCGAVGAALAPDQASLSLDKKGKLRYVLRRSFSQGVDAMNDLVQRLTQEQPIIASLRPEATAQRLKEAVDRGYVHIKFTETRGGTELGIRLIPELSDLTGANYADSTGTIRIAGDLTLDYVPVRFHGHIDLASMAGTGRLEVREEAPAPAPAPAE